MSDDAITVSYASRRDEVARYYWILWKRRLWRIHLTVISSVVLLGVILQLNALTIGAVCAAIIAGFILFPQLAFKPATRSLTIDPRGVHTTIGKRDGNRTWREIGSVEQMREGVVITVRKTGNAFIVPRRAFTTDGSREAFLQAAQRWWTENQGHA